MTAIYDTMQFIRPEIQTVCLGQAASAAAVLLAAGTPGKRLALPNARVLIHQPALGGGERGTATDLQIQADEVIRMREWLATTLADLSNKEADEVDRDIERDLFMTASAAKDYGLVDEVITSRKVRPGSITR
jgi:ATP-dependent Clp protease protease subunit